MKTFKNKDITINCFISHVGCKKPIIVKSAIISATIVENKDGRVPENARVTLI